MDLKNSILIVFVSVAITGVLTEFTTDHTSHENETTSTVDPITTSCRPENCTESGDCYYYESTGCIDVLSDKKPMRYVLDVQNTSSIIRLEMIPCSNVTDGVLISTKITELDDEVHTWIIDGMHHVRRFKYLSQSSRIRIEIDGTKTKTWCNIRLNYQELKFEIYKLTDESDSGTLSSEDFGDTWYRANTARIYHLAQSSELWNSSSVSITVTSLNIERTYESEDSYLLIGAGNETFNGPAAAHLSGQITTPKKYHIASGYAYIVFFIGSNDERFDFKITWQRTGEKITKPKDDVDDKTIPDSTLQAAPVCFYNASWITEFNKTTQTIDMFSKFQAKFAEIANRYVKEKKLKYIQEIRAESIRLIQVSSIFRPNAKDDDLANGALYTIIGIVQPYDSRMSVFRWHEMQDILERFDAYDENTDHNLLGFKVGKCPGNADYRSWYYATALVAIVCGVLFLTIWLCSMNTTWRNRRYRNNIKKLSRKLPRLPTRRNHAANEYMAYDNNGFVPPKISITNDQGMSIPTKNDQKVPDKRYTSVLSDEDSDEEIFMKSWMKSNPSLMDLPADAAYDAEATRLRRMHMFDVPLHDDVSGQPRRLWRPMEIKDDSKQSTATNEYIFGKIFDDDDILDRTNTKNTKL